MGPLSRDVGNLSGCVVIEQGTKYRVEGVSKKDDNGISELELTVALPGVDIPTQVVESLKVDFLSAAYELIIKDPNGRVLY